MQAFNLVMGIVFGACWMMIAMIAVEIFLRRRRKDEVWVVMSDVVPYGSLLAVFKDEALAKKYLDDMGEYNPHAHAILYPTNGKDYRYDGGLRRYISRELPSPPQEPAN